VTPGGFRINVGCGPDVAPGWLNVDKSPSVWLAKRPRTRRLLSSLRILTPEQAAGLPEGIISADASKRLPFGDGTAAYIYSGHMIEHLSRWQGAAFLAECHRVLRRDGVVRISTPDLAQLVRSYLDGEIVVDGATTPADSFVLEYGAYFDLPISPVQRLVRRHFSGAIHQWLYDENSLTTMLKEAGFIDPRRCEYQVGTVPDLDSVERRPRSLFLEARKG
jgi:predicted SAM-dependent methyltransferase